MSRSKRRRQRQRREHHHRPKTYWAPPGELREVEDEEIERLAYTRKQAAEALGVSISTIDRHLVKVVDTVKTPWGQRLIPVAGIERFLHEHLEPARGRQPRRPAGRPATLPRTVVERIRLEYARGRGLTDIARRLTIDGVPTAHGGRQWWPSTVRAVLARSVQLGEAPTSPNAGCGASDFSCLDARPRHADRIFLTLLNAVPCLVHPVGLLR